MQISDTLTPEELKEHLSYAPNFIRFIFDFHSRAVILKLQEMGFKVNSVDGAKLKIEELIEKQNPAVAMAIDVKPVFEGLPDHFREVVEDIINKK